MTTCNDPRCPNCGGYLKYYDSVRRLVKGEGGVTQHVKIRRLRCVKCKTIRREMPDRILPYKHYSTDIIQGVIDGEITPDTLGYEDYPCEMTMRRWLRTRGEHTPL